ncbi:unnamed protein product [Rotaria sordida]|uniref:Uncharacterized protein n=1 Tax=Rotaria sordida TaxID=392033 RepID=A0A815ELZ9_9BILA|nr:unnamed protein product [Rotaria sordida]CAF1404351.1 unnamed protein product [Rotaria sordida]CAF3835710.1 unnamed protein product [Rotaria sordida]CAF3899327.1 unnamed protein product [Rotaria sordida]
MDDMDNDILFEFESYEEFQRERLKLNAESTLKLWYSLPSNLTNIDNKLIRQQTLKQQKKRLRNLKFFAIYSMFLKKTFLKNRIRSKGFQLWNKTFNIPSLNDPCLYQIYQSLGRITNQFLNRGKEYDSKISYQELYKAGRTVWFMIAFQIQLNLPLILTDSIFGYNMLYPYTDDFIDSNQVSKETKIEFKKIFHDKLLHGQSTYNSNAHFHEQQSNVNHLNIEVYADKLEQIFDMVKFIENDWKRDEKNRGVYMSLATIHESQMKSILQHAKIEDGYQPTMTLIEQISAEKGGASLIAAAFLIEGQLTRAKMAYLEYLGFAFQLLDDLQDFHEDMKNNHRTIFTQTFLDGKTLDEPTGRLIQYCYSSPAFKIFSDDQHTISDSKNQCTLAHYVRISMMMFAIILILEAASQLKKYYSKQFYQDLSTLSPIPFDQLKTISVEEKIWAVVQNQWF